MRGDGMYEVTANLCDEGDYVRSWTGGTFKDAEAAVRFFDGWWPPKDEVDEEVRKDPDACYQLQIGVWDENGNDLAFWSEEL